jgi:hypothetical protein
LSARSRRGKGGDGFTSERRKREIFVVFVEVRRREWEERGSQNRG